jgi:hypothetical protein
LLDEGEFGPALSVPEAAEEAGFSGKHVLRQIIKRAVDLGVVEAAIGQRPEAAYQRAIKLRDSGHDFPQLLRGGPGAKRKTTEEQDRRIAEDYASGNYVQHELARREGVSDSTIQRILRRTDIER